MRRVRAPAPALVLAGLAALAPAAGGATWSAPERVSPPDRASYSGAAIAAGTGGAALAAWVRTPAGAPRGAGRVQMAARPAGERWGAARSLSGPGASLPRVALNPRGDAAAAWANGRLIVAALRRGAAGRWRAVRVAEASAPVRDLHLSVDRAGRATAVWVERRGAGFLVRVATGGPGARWEVRPPRLTTPGPEPPSLALSPGRGALAAWVDDGRVLAARTVAGAFERPVELADHDAGAPGAGLGASGAALLAWNVRLPGGTRVMQAAGRPAAAPRWGTADDLGIGGAPVVAIGDAGDAVVAWGAGEVGGEQWVGASTRRRGGLWRASTVVAPRSCDCALSAAAAAIDGTGRAVVAWRRDGGGEGPRAGAAALTPRGDRWQPAPIAGGRVAAAPAVAAAPTSGAGAAWASAGAGGDVRTAHHRGA
jgi:hypothetical protein